MEVDSVYGDSVSQVLDVALVSETRSSFVQGYYEGLIGAIVGDSGYSFGSTIPGAVVGSGFHML